MLGNGKSMCRLRCRRTCRMCPQSLRALGSVLTRCAVASGGPWSRPHSRSVSMSGSEGPLGPPSPPGYDSRLPVYRSASW